MNLLAYIPAIVAFLAAFVAILGKPKWDSRKAGLRKLTRAGWLTATLATVALGASLYLTWKAERDLSNRTMQANDIRQLAHTELRLAIQQVIEEFLPIVRHPESASGIVGEAPPEVDCGRFPECMLNPTIKEFAGEVTSPRPRKTAQHYTHQELMSDPTLVRYHNAHAFIATTQYRIEWHATEGVEHIDRTLEIYAPYLEPKILLLMSQLRRSDYLWVLLRLDRPFREATEANRQVGATYEPNAYGYDAFWTTATSLLEDETKGGLFRDRNNDEVWESQFPRAAR